MLDEATRAMLRQLRSRKPARDPQRLWIALTAAVLLHVLFGWVVWRQMRPALEVLTMPASNDEAIDIRFIPRAPSPAAAPPAPDTPVPPPAEPRTEASRQRVVPKPAPKPKPAAHDAMTAQLPPPRPSDAPSPKLFDQNGQPLLPASAASTPSKPAADYAQRMPTDSDKVMQHATPIEYAPTRFDKYWHKSSTVDDALQKAVDATTVSHTINLPRGVRIHCSISLAMLAGGCGGDPPPPPSKKDGDERLSMAPAQPLAKDPHLPTPPTIEACIAMYRADKPLAYGCPVDTPDRAVDAEKAEAAAKAASGKP